MSLDHIIARQGGVISRAQALGAGLSSGAVDHRLRLRRWDPLHPCVYLVAGHRNDGEVSVRAALLWAGDGAVLSGSAAAWWHGIAADLPTSVGITVPRRRRVRGRPGIAVRWRDLASADLVGHRGLATTARPLTVLEAAVELGASGSRFLDGALQRQVRFPEVYAAHCRNLGSPGSASAGLLLAAAADRAASAAQRLLVRLLREAGFAGWHCGFPFGGSPVGPFRIDVAFPAARVAVQAVGWAWHLDIDRVLADTRRRRALARQRWTILSYTWHDLVDRSRAVLAEITRAVRQGMAQAS